MRIMALVLASFLAVCFVDTASAATRHSVGKLRPLVVTAVTAGRGCSTRLLPMKF